MRQANLLSNLFCPLLDKVKHGLNSTDLALLSCIGQSSVPLSIEQISDINTILRRYQMLLKSTID